MKNPIKSFISGVKNIWYYLPIIWSDKDYDYTYILILLHKKLKKHEHWLVFSKYCWDYVGRERDAKALHVCILLLERLIKDDYLKMLKINWPDDLLNGLPDCTIPGWSGKFGWGNYEEYMRHQDLNLLLKIMNKHLFDWWD